jgi:hypothetical protein
MDIRGGTVNRTLPRVVPGLTLVLTALALASCSAIKAAAPQNPITTAQSNEAAVEVGVMIYTGTEPTPVPSSLTTGDPRSAGTLSSRRATAAAAETTIANGNVTWTLAVRWFDAGSNEQAIYDPSTTVRMQANSHGTGTVTGANGSATLNSGGVMNVSGIDQAASALTTNATRNDTLSWTATGQNGSISTLTHSTGTLANVVEAKPIAQNYPASGNGTWDLDVNRQIEGAGGGSISEHFTAHVVVTFNGTHLVPLVVNGTHHFLLDLDTGLVTQVG